MKKLYTYFAMAMIAMTTFTSCDAIEFFEDMFDIKPELKVRKANA